MATIECASSLAGSNLQYYFLPSLAAVDLFGMLLLPGAAMPDATTTLAVKTLSDQPWPMQMLPGRFRFTLNCSIGCLVKHEAAMAKARRWFV